MSVVAIRFSMSVPAADVKAFTDALKRYEKETQRDMRGAVRSATLDLLRSLRARTRRAPKVVPRGDVRWGEETPKYYTGKKDGKVYRRVVVTRWFKGKRSQHVHWQEVRTKYRSRKTRNGISESWSEATPAMLREARQTFGRIRQWGLAEKSWGWFMRALFQQSVKDENQHARIRSGMVDKAMVERDGSVSITIVNKLDYIRKALKPGALSSSLRAAANSINKKITAGLRSRRFGA